MQISKMSDPNVIRAKNPSEKTPFQKFRDADPVKYSSETWGSPVLPLIGLLIVSLLFGLGFYFAFYPMFEDITREAGQVRSNRGIFHANNTENSVAPLLGGGFVSILAALTVFAAGAIFGLSYAQNSKFLMYSVVITLLLAYIYHLCIMAARDLESSWFVTLTVIFAILVAGLSGVGFLRIYRTKNKADEAAKNKGQVPQEPTEDKKLVEDEKVQDADSLPELFSDNDIAQIKMRFNIGFALIVILVISAILLLYTHYEMYTDLSLESTKPKPEIPMAA